MNINENFLIQEEILFEFFFLYINIFKMIIIK